MSNGAQSEQDEHYPDWEPTDWTPRQRTAAISSLLLLTLACALIAGALGRWGTGPLALNTFAPIGIMLFCLGALLLSFVFWYTYKHGQNSVGDTSSATAAYWMLGLGALVT